MKLIPLVMGFGLILAVMTLTVDGGTQRGYTFANVDRHAERFLPVLKARMGCPDSWDYEDGLEQCREAAAHKDLDAYDRAGRSARRLWLLNAPRD